MNFNIEDWDKRNVDILSSDEFCVREVLSSFTLDFDLGSKEVPIKAWSVKCQSTNVTWHYVLFYSSTDGVILHIYDDYYELIQSFTYNVKLMPETASLSIIEDQLLITSPSLRTVFGIVGSGVVYATSQPSVNTMTTALEEIPKGISVSWAGRLVIADRQTLFISDALYPRTFVGENTLDPPGGAILGLHVDAGGALIICTTTGVYGLSEDAAASSQVVIGVFSKLSGYNCLNYNNTVSHRGLVYGLTERGVTVIDASNQPEILLDEKTVPTNEYGRIFFRDYREGRIFSGNESLFIQVDENTTCVVNTSRKFKSWWQTNTALTYLAGVGFENDGTEIFINDRIVFKLGNNTTNSRESRITGVVAGRFELPPEISPVLRTVDFMSDSWDTMSVFIRDQEKSITPKKFSPIIGTDSWDTPKYIESRFKSIETSWSLRGDDLPFTLKVKDYPFKIPKTLDCTFKGPGKKRSTN
jgi:hypothetical protein